MGKGREGEGKGMGEGGKGGREGTPRKNPGYGPVKFQFDVRVK